MTQSTRVPDDLARVMLWRAGAAEPLTFETSRHEGEELRELLRNRDDLGAGLTVCLRSYQSGRAPDARSSTLAVSMDAIDMAIIEMAPRVTLASR